MNKYFKYDWSNKEQLLIDLNNFSNMSQFLKNYGLTPTSGNFKTLKKWLLIHNILIDDIYERKLKKNVFIKPIIKIENEGFFAKNSLHARKDLRKKIKNDNLIPYKCAGCQNNGVWQGKKLVLQLEHKNGDHFDNRIENLEYLCPNCHTQTKTYGSKNIHNKLFNKRLVDMLEIKEINENNIIILVEKWNRKYSGVKSWIKKYKQKIIESGIVINLDGNTYRSKFIEFEKIIEKIKLTDYSLIAIENLAKDININFKTLRRKIKEKDPLLFNKLQKAKTITKKEADIKIQKERLEYIKNLDINNLKIDEIKSFFKISSSGLYLWLLKNASHIFYKLKSPLEKECTKCKSKNIVKKGIIKRETYILQKYKCKECEMCFNYCLN